LRDLLDRLDVANATLEALEAVEDPDEATQAATLEAAANVHNIFLKIEALGAEGQAIVLDDYEDLEDVEEEDAAVDAAE